METTTSVEMFTSNPAEVQFDVVMHQQILFLANNFCLCPGARKVSTDSVLDTSTQGEDLVIKQPSRTIKSRKKNRLLKSRNTKEGLFQLQRILDSYAGTEELVVARSAKSKNNTRLHKSGRRSSYIGVSKNGDVWQALIMIDSKKTYIGSYHTEKEAAMAYDFFSIVLKQLAAKTNFDYSLTLLKKMVHNYHSNDQEFVPSE